LTADVAIVGCGPVGTIFPQPRLADGRLMDEAVGQRFVVVGDAALLEGLRTDAVLLPGVGFDWLERYGARAAILRPDRYVFALARDWTELKAALTRAYRRDRTA